MFVCRLRSPAHHGMFPPAFQRPPARRRRPDKVRAWSLNGSLQLQALSLKLEFGLRYAEDETVKSVALLRNGISFLGLCLFEACRPSDNNIALRECICFCIHWEYKEWMMAGLSPLTCPGEAALKPGIMGQANLGNNTISH